ncbi:4570_t:CDS:2 [Funneliformis mosseae]|uniref:4570_t:CDS:1 n=1 Tax=Funneliformis mosseae TaxID=27381 RepID=A0A9N9A2L4_FUNMO|nr:4570_t:CDS:2 [Funneliformis mosseae]
MNKNQLINYQLILHALGVASFSYSFIILPTLERSETLIYQFTHLTIVGLLFSLFAFIFALLYDFFTFRVISFLKDWFMVICVPLEGLISVLYWTIITYDEKLLMEKPRLPIFIDFGFHLIPAVCLWTDFLFFAKEFRKSYAHVLYILAFGIGYVAWINFYFVTFGDWPYPLLRKLEDPQRFGCYVVCVSLCAFIHAAFNKPAIASKLQQIHQIDDKLKLN